MQPTAMPSETRRSLERAIEQLAAQRRRYALALGAAPTDRARERHLRTVARLDEEIEAHVDARAAIASSADVVIATPPHEDALLEQANTLVSGSYARGEVDEALGTPRATIARVITVAFAVGFLVVALAMALLGH
jgi:hypothetical protein